MRTWAAGLAYGNGLSASPATGLVNYYAERCPEIPKTVDFARTASADPGPPNVGDYAVAQLFYSRSGGDYAARAAAHSADDAWGPRSDEIRRFRQRIRALRDRTNLDREIAERRPRVLARLFPGAGAPKTGEGGYASVAVGDERQLDAWAAWLEAQGEPALVRLYPRDFWI